MPKLGMEPVRRKALIDGLRIRRSLFHQNADPDWAIELVEHAIFQALDRADA